MLLLYDFLLAAGFLSYIVIIVLNFEMFFKKNKKLFNEIYIANIIGFVFIFCSSFLKYGLNNAADLNILLLCLCFVLSFLPSFITFCYSKLKKQYILYLILSIAAWMVCIISTFALVVIAFDYKL